MRVYFDIIRRAVVNHRARWLAISLGFVVLYYVGLLVFTMLRFGEIPNYAVFHDVFGAYRLIFDGTPALSDVLPIVMDEAWFEAGYKNPLYYGIATWSYMLIPPKVLLVFLTGVLVATVVVLAATGKELVCPTSPIPAYATAGTGAALVGLTSATLTWVVCCATPSWVVSLAMLGMSVSLALWLEPAGMILPPLGLALIVGIIVKQLRGLAAANGSSRLASATT